MARQMAAGGKHFLGFEKEPPQPHGPRMPGKAIVHSHAKHAPKKIHAGKKVSSKTSI